MTGDSSDTRIGRLEGKLESIAESLSRLHADNVDFKDRQVEMSQKIDKLTTERNMLVAAVSAISATIGTFVTYFLSHPKS